MSTAIHSQNLRSIVTELEGEPLPGMVVRGALLVVHLVDGLPARYGTRLASQLEIASLCILVA